MNHLVKRLREGEDGLEYAAADEIEELEDRISSLEMALYAIANICLITCLRPGIEAQKMQSIAVAALIKCDCDGQCKSYGQCISKARATVTGDNHEAAPRP